MMNGLGGHGWGMGWWWIIGIVNISNFNLSLNKNLHIKKEENVNKL